MVIRTTRRLFVQRWLIPLLMLTLGACDTGGDEGPRGLEETGCTIPTSQLRESTAVDAIPALTDPELVGIEEIEYLTDDDLVVGIYLGEEIVAVPHNILNWHEVVNFNTTTPQVAVTFCPLTGSALAFDRTAIGNAEFGVSGLIYLNNNVMFDRRSSSSLWSQMSRGAVCGKEAGTMLRPVPLVEMTWGGWRSLYPESRVLSSNTGFTRNYRNDPNRVYKEPDNPQLLFPMPVAVDRRRPPKERVLGLPDGDGGLAFPLAALDNGAPFRIVTTTFQGQPLVVFFDREREAAGAYRLTGAHAGHTFTVTEGQLRDTETGSVWEVDGRAVTGPLAGSRLTPVDEAYISFWFAWATFQPEAALWTDDV